MNTPQLLHFFKTHWTFIIFICFCFFILVQAFYYSFFFFRILLYRSKKNQQTQSQTHPLSVIICARDEAANLADFLPGVLVQNYPTTHEVIVVNDNSFDDSKYFLEELKKTFKHLKIIELTQEAELIPGKKFPLAVGIKSAKYEIMLLTDADCLPATENWISSMQSCYTDNTEIVLGYSPYFKKPGLLNKIIRWETYHTAMQYLSYALAGIPYMGVGRNLSYKKNLFNKQKGFSTHNNIPGGDDDLFINQVAHKYNTAINIEKESFVMSKPASTWKQWIQQKSRHYTTGKYYKRKHKFLLGLYSLSQFLIYPLAISTCIFYNWRLGSIIFGGRLLLFCIVNVGGLKKLDEKDLIPGMLMFDIWMFFYYFIFSFSLIKRPKQYWK